MSEEAPLRSSVYQVLRAMAARRMAGERPDHTLGATALVHEAFLRIAKPGQTGFDAGSFYRQAGEAMRHILIDHARKRNAVKRGGGEDQRAPRGGAAGIPAIENLDSLAESATVEEVVALDGAFLRLCKEDPRAGDVVRLRFYAGLTVEQTADALGVSRRSVLRDWEFARAFLMAELEKQSKSEGGAA